MSDVTEWVVLYWMPERKEQRFKTRPEAMRFLMRISPHAKVFLDEVFVGEAAHVR